MVLIVFQTSMGRRILRLFEYNSESELTLVILGWWQARNKKIVGWGGGWGGLPCTFKKLEKSFLILGKNDLIVVIYE